MATVREHLRKAHEAMAAHHQAMSKCHTSAMSKSADHQQEFHRAAAAAHDAAAESHMEMCEACAKAMTDDLNKVVPTRVSAVVPNAPGVTAVPRAGQRPIEKSVDPEFAFLAKADSRDDED